MFRKIPIHPILFAIYPILFLYTNNISLLQIDHIYIKIIWSVCGTFILWGIVNMFIKNKYKSAAIVSLIVLQFFSYGHLIEALHRFPEKIIGISSDLYLSLNYILIAFITIYLIVKYHKKYLSVSGFLNFLGFLLLVYPVFATLTYYEKAKINSTIQERNVPVSLVSTEHFPELARPDIYYVILDGYARGDILKSLYEFDNSEFYHSLNDRDFIVLDRSLSNYAQTSLSLASSLNMNYIDSLIQGINPDSDDNSSLQNLISNSIVVKMLKEKNYKFITFSSGLSFFEIKNSDLYISLNVSINEFENLLIETTPLRLIRKMVSKPSPLSVHRDNILFTLNEIPRIDRDYSPKFVFAHIIAPHPPFVLGRDDNDKFENEKLIYGDGSHYHSMKEELQFEYKDKYLRQLKALNIKVLDMIDAILRNNKNKESIIILQADHGPRLMLNWENPDSKGIDETFPILNAFYLPKRLEVKPVSDLTPVNSFRFIFNQLFQSELDILPNKSYFSKWSRPFDFIEANVQ